MINSNSLLYNPNSDYPRYYRQTRKIRVYTHISLSLVFHIALINQVSTIKVQKSVSVTERELIK